MTHGLLNLDPSLSDTTHLPDDPTATTPKTIVAAPFFDAANASSTSGEQPNMTIQYSGNGDRTGKGDEKARTKLSRLLKEKEQEWTAVAQRDRPLGLLDLPVDVIKEIVKEVTHTNDLTALALTHSALHNLAIPHIYSRFDIVWPDLHATTDTRTGVDALTYGLATLVMGEDVFDYRPISNSRFETASGHTFLCTKCGTRNHDGSDDCLGTGGMTIGRRRFGNSYPQYTRKFSIGNGPPEWVQEYMVTKESGKMLGTLVALAVARMVNLETFIWDMPTGVLRDVWLALSSLQHRNPRGECRLEKVWVRWHDNYEGTGASALQTSTGQSNSFHQVPAGGNMTSIGLFVALNSASATPSHPSVFPPAPAVSSNRVEYPTLSVLPPLKSLSVLDIDELAYLDEMSILIERSKSKLRELRVGIAAKAQWQDFVTAWDGPDLHQVDHNASNPATSSIPNKRLGGVLGIILGRVFDIRRKYREGGKPVRPPQNETQSSNSGELAVGTTQTSQNLGSSAALAEQLDILTKEMEQLPSNLSGSVDSTNMQPPTGLFNGAHNNGVSASRTNRSEVSGPNKNDSEHRNTEATRVRLDGKLRLQVLELERVPLSVAVLQRAFDWSVLTSLTFLDCPHHETLWRALRRQFQPQPSMGATGRTNAHASKGISNVPLEYQLSLRKLHTDAASPALIAFLKETLAPNSLEVLFLQDRRRTGTSTVSMDSIFKGPIKRHRSSLKKLLIDSSDRIPRAPGSSSEGSRYKAWMFNREILSYITSGRMSRLRELSIALEYKDWHFFLQRLPQIPHLRSLNIPYIADHVTATYDPKELALQIVDIIHLRSEIELCYIGLSNKCFEILENKPQDEQPPASEAQAHQNAVHGDVELDEEDDEDGSEDDDEDDEEEDDDDGTAIGIDAHDDSDFSENDDSDSDSFDGSEDERHKIHLRLREILFYDDKVAIFKARHGRL